MKNLPEIPLAERVRPKTISEFTGQRHLIGENGPLYKCVENGYLPSMILWGPPGTGKTTLAYILSRSLDLKFQSISAIEAGVKEIKEVIKSSKEKGLFDQGKTVLFVDEIHRFSKSQQDYLLGAVERGEILLIGATTENPSFEVIPALLSRCQVYVLNPLSKEELEQILTSALEKDEFLKGLNIIVESTDLLFLYSGGDARKMLNLLELSVNAQLDKTEIIINDDNIRSVAQQFIQKYDKQGENHYDTISAFIKSIRGSDPNAAIYWLARMIDSGEDPLFIARRLIISAAEDIGLANPTALVIANNAFQAVNQIGMPEGRIILAEATIYLACSPKSNSAYLAIDYALQKVKETGQLPVPLHLRNAPTQLMKELGYGQEYKYDHNYEGNFAHQEFMPVHLQNTTFYKPGNNLREKEYQKFLFSRWGDKYYKE
ncbi:MAG: ATPase AAA [Vicingaceae bacterium]|nr:MAG: ATPase AAA [Vicingaceae bacterium]GIV42589.1 MAG: ATPase AAA [Vicingaceae bacterium]